MELQTPHYLLLSETSRTVGVGRWRFVLRPVEGSAAAAIEATDIEPDVWGERLDLLTVVRALETLDQPSRVTLVGCSRYVEQGIMYGLNDWKENGWCWEWFGQMTPVRDADLWQRMDRALAFHRVECRQRRIDPGHGLVNGPHWNLLDSGKNLVNGMVHHRLKDHARLLAAWCGACVRLLLGTRRVFSASA
ncbi:MAG: RNase H family protein [Thermoguttaceae bacterium]